MRKDVAVSVVMTEYQEFRGQAIYCATLAQTITSQPDKIALLEMAQKWADLAEGVRDLEPRTIVMASRTPAVVVPFRR